MENSINNDLNLSSSDNESDNESDYESDYESDNENFKSFLSTIYKKMEIKKFKDSLMDLRTILEVMEKNSD